MMSLYGLQNSISSFNVLKVTAQSIPNMTVVIGPGGFWNYTYRTVKYVEFFGDITPTIERPKLHPNWVIVAIDGNATIKIIYGIENHKLILPEVPFDHIPLAAIYTSPALDKITNDIIYDIRPYLELSTNDNISNQFINFHKNRHFIKETDNINFRDTARVVPNIFDNQINDKLDIRFDAVHSILTSEGLNVVAGTTVSGGQQFDLIPNPGSSPNYSGQYHSHGTVANPLTEHVMQYNHNLLHSNINDPTFNEKQALQGTSGVPGPNNQYITVADYRLCPNVFPYVATHNIEAYKVLTINLSYASKMTMNGYPFLLGMALNSANVGEIVRVQVAGLITNPNWNFSLDSAVFLGTNGDYDQNFDISHVIPIGVPINPTTILYRPLCDNARPFLITEFGIPIFADTDYIYTNHI